ncbi:MAG: ATP-binding cassette domain-containing protein [Cytophagaceae bacterium]
MNESGRDKLCIEAKKISLCPEGKNLLKEISFELYEGEAMAITGGSGSGNTLLGKILAGQVKVDSGELVCHFPQERGKLLIGQQHNFRDSSSTSYYQQRFDSNYGNSSPTVEAELQKISGVQAERIKQITRQLKIDHLLQSRLIELSNGEGKRLQLARGLLLEPGLIVLDNPFLGLDTEARKILHGIINDLISSGIIIFLITSLNEIPEKISTVLELEEGAVKRIVSRDEFLKSAASDQKEINPEPDFHLLEKIGYPQEEGFEVAVEMKNVSISYGEKKILDNISWKVKKGECWGLLGPNGSGKSTLLSLINGDNPQAYGNDIWLFDRKKGSGESIWDIKNRIGYISPELHIFFQRNLSPVESLVMTGAAEDLSGYSVSGPTAYEAVASGFRDQIGSSQKINTYQHRLVSTWLEILGIKYLQSDYLYKVSLGNQRLLLLARALVKDPPLLILDEPCQGLDAAQTRRFTNIVDEICHRLNKTLIYVSHYPEDFPSCVDRFIRLENGKIIS